MLIFLSMAAASLIITHQLLDAKMAELAREADDGWDTGAGAMEGSSVSIETATDSDSREGHSPFKIINKV